MFAVLKGETLALALLALVALLVACDGDSDSRPDGDLPPQPIEGGLPPDFPDDFPLYPNLNIVRSSPLGQRYVIEANSEDPAQDIVNFYEQVLTKGRWELLATEDSSDPNSTTFRFTARGFAVDGRVMVAEDTRDGDRIIIAIAMPMEAGERD